VEKVEVTSIATVLDPRFKKRGFLKPDNADAAVLRFRELGNYTRLEKQASTEPEPKPSATSKAKDGRKVKKPRMDLRQYFGDDAPPVGVDDFGENLDLYASTPNIPPTFSNVFECWSHNKFSFPVCYELSKKYLYIPATSASSERVFSTAGYVLNQKRSSMKGTNVNALIFLNQNMKFSE
jgi:hypothetical protein